MFQREGEKAVHKGPGHEHLTSAKNSIPSAEETPPGVPKGLQGRFAF